MLSSVAIRVGAIPYSGMMTRQVVRTAGPTIMGVPRGTAPSSSAGVRRLWPEPIRSLMAIPNRTTPPAIMKSPIVMPSA